MVTPFKVGDEVRFKDEPAHQAYARRTHAAETVTIVKVGHHFVYWLNKRGKRIACYAHRVVLAEGPW